MFASGLVNINSSSIIKFIFTIFKIKFTLYQLATCLKVFEKKESTLEQRATIEIKVSKFHILI